MGSRMAQEDHMVKVEATAARNGFSDLINKVRYGSDRVLIERRGKDVAALISIEDLRLLEILEDQIDIEAARKALRSEEHTSELQSRLHLVCRLLLEKKKNN